MKDQRNTAEPRMRKGFLLALGGFTVIAILVLAALRPSKQAQAPVLAADTQASAQAAAETPQESVSTPPPVYAPLELGALKEKPTVARAEDSPLHDIKLTFKLDPRLTGSLYMGDRWVCPPIYFRTGDGPECSFEATIKGINGRGRATQITPTITPADPDMVTVSPGPGKAVKVTVHHPGKTSLQVAALGLTKRLPLNALAHGNTIVVEVYQQ